MPNTQNPHTVTSFDQELLRLDELISRQFALVRSMLHDALLAVSSFDCQLAQQVILRDTEIDELEQSIEANAIRVLALRSPLAGDLRWVIAIQKASAELERMGDLSKNISRRVGVLALHPLAEATGGLRVMGFMVLEQLDRMQQAWIAEARESATTVWLGDEAVDSVHESIFRELLTHMMESPKKISACIHLLFIARNLERIGDHITNIAEDLLFRIDGKKPTRGRPKADNTGLIADLPSCASSDMKADNG